MCQCSKHCSCVSFCKRRIMGGSPRHCQLAGGCDIVCGLRSKHELGGTASGIGRHYIVLQYIGSRTEDRYHVSSIETDRQMQSFISRDNCWHNVTARLNSTSRTRMKRLMHKGDFEVELRPDLCPTRRPAHQGDGSKLCS